jgi:uncharacterized OB-fold protein
MSLTDTPSLQIGHCSTCGSYTFPSTSWGCRCCGQAPLAAVPLPQPARLINFVTLNAEIVPGLPVPCVIGELEIAPGVVEEGLLDVSDESELALGMTMQAVPRAAERGSVAWAFRPMDGATA